ncbi:helicase/Zfx/Zfy transcription activation region domain-containing protein [Escherichia coli]|uniref:Helicase/Zfx/Zfy transcription activation region domain-containing protein n=1 Tax=Escherichia coli TaxID=562 RepID=A0A376KLV2_ECOLX|nr:helicase/Zfx/Zfy transcription activation region domain-containing protein [Escherichia coli]
MIAVMFSPYLSVRGFIGFVPGSVLFRPRLYDSAERKGRYQPVSGYLVKSRSLFSGKGLPGDSPFITFP